MNVVGETFREVPKCFEEASHRFSDHIENWGYAESVEEYRRILASSDLIVSTAIHEFFGIAAVEAMSAGCLPVFPNRLSYPELVNQASSFLYDGTTQELADSIKRWSEIRLSDPERFHSRQTEASELASRFAWQIRAQEMDDHLEQIADR
ncbi:GDP-mannose:cellobiosyl-diphosphopolyprenol alpha-mannosyltransferase [Thalassoglobus neptunius]|uniref:GDP-mannose:cellobiosyl-diphosphopolyprenol alpha-mannosyltransferase n=1 Tax=Thalassoglobus neptunius TaxID=1938619 RepID=A0A5C5X2E0_9PLAN|nr:GDP-mannose:cellobiosyl-diphosphopolyprenol alpha-mannosyltransferase [Thalassoglobus neptunius]